jgi:hypothetical protein
MVELFSNIMDKILPVIRRLRCLAGASSVNFLTERVSPVFSASPAPIGSMPGKLPPGNDRGTLVLTGSDMLFGSSPGFFLIFKSLKVMLVNFLALLLMANTGSSIL